MTTEIYQRVIDQWCEATGMSPWPIEDAMNVSIGDITAGLIYDSQNSAGVLHIFSSLDVLAFDGLQRRMLELNMSIDPAESGVFAWHPETNQAVYRIDLPLEPGTDGGTLPQLISELVGAARVRLLT